MTVQSVPMGKICNFLAEFSNLSFEIRKPAIPRFLRCRYTLAILVFSH
jgi:hypothetical protein